MGMTTAELQKLALSQTVYEGLPQEGNPGNDGNPWTIRELLEAGYIRQASYDENATPQFSTSSPQLSALSGMLGWKLVNVQPNMTSGFAGAAFQAPSGEIVFAFRGVELDIVSPNHPTGIANDAITAAQVAVGGNLGEPNQFKDAKDFFDQTRNLLAYSLFQVSSISRISPQSLVH